MDRKLLDKIVGKIDMNYGMLFCECADCGSHNTRRRATWPVRRAWLCEVIERLIREAAEAAKGADGEVMTINQMIEQVKTWIVDRSRTTKQSIDLAENIRDLCEEWIDALKGDLADGDADD